MYIHGQMFPIRGVAVLMSVEVILLLRLYVRGHRTQDFGRGDSFRNNRHLVAAKEGRNQQDSRRTRYLDLGWQSTGVVHLGVPAHCQL